MILLEKQRESINSTSPSTSTSTIIEEFTQNEDDLSKCVIFYLFILTKKQ